MFEQLVTTQQAPQRRHKPAVTPGKLTTRIVEYIRQHPGCTAYTLECVLNESPARVLQTLYRMDNSGVIKSRMQRPAIGCGGDRCPEFVRHYFAEVLQ